MILVGSIRGVIPDRRIYKFRALRRAVGEYSKRANEVGVK
jgi:hypothetical protein